ncbi:glycosyltransferase family 4 protein [Rariglobus hedericola]|uniref:Glycosyltransferase n=1 Tax=Rariglobus hedericola TaxID=2597822 RepID=A0A556QJN9_9BACT|nr:glycosyltransferase [Rariglobus hedericola]TSJ76848.1 glycosyltransferase [Rariglobus hedericola]
MLRILIVSTATGYGGAERSLELLAPELAQRADVLVLTGNTRHRRNLHTAARRAGVPITLWPLPLDENRCGSRNTVLAFHAARLLFRPDVILTNTELSAMIVSRAAQLPPRHSAIPTWIYVRDFLWFDLPGVFTRLPEAQVLIPGPAVLERPAYLTPWVAPSTPRSVSIIPDMVALPDLTSLTARTARSGYVLHLATVNPWKGHTHLIRAAALLRTAGRPVHIRSRGVTGIPQLRHALEQQIAAAGLAGSEGFELLEHAEDPADELRHCSCVVVTSVSRDGGPETFGRTIIEAWSHGRPVVAFAAGSMPHLITHNEDGLLVPEGDEQALADALWLLYTDPALAARLGARGLEKARRHFTVDRVADQLIALFKTTQPARIL